MIMHRDVPLQLMQRNIEHEYFGGDEEIKPGGAGEIPGKW